MLFQAIPLLLNLHKYNNLKLTETCNGYRVII